jgi:hypothetical protein
MVLSFDRRYLSALDTISVRLDRFFSAWGKKVKGQEFADRHNNEVMKHLKSFNFEYFFLVSSSTRTIGSKSGFFVYRGELDNASIDAAASRPFNNTSDMAKSKIITANLVGKKVMSDLNRVEIPGHILSKLEIVAESLLQMSFIEITHSIISTIGRINQWGFGELKDFTYFKFISTSDKNVTDYLTMVFWRPAVLQATFLEKAVPIANRNSKGIRLYAKNRFEKRVFPENRDFPPQLQEFARRLGAKPTEEIEIISIDGEDYIATGFNGQQLEVFQLIILYPVSNIDRSIAGQKTDLLLLAFFSLLLAAGLAQILSHSFVTPLAALRQGATAIEDRRFDHRIAGTGNDEFGEVADIFNSIMVGFEELEVARIVQESLFPAPAFNQGRFSIYGKSICMSELGGDYLDFFRIDEQHFSVLMGDVAGHGVGAALIMAMAKAGILSSGSCLGSPAQLLQNLHQMILASKNSRQKKVMTFQYLYIDSQSGAGVYANAGACSPFIVRKSRDIVEEVSLAGSALGAFKRASFNEAVISLEPGDAMIFYTDGIIESRDNAGQEIGYQGFTDLLLQAYDPEPEKYYHNLFTACSEHLMNREAQDDITLIIMVHNKDTASIQP